MSPPITQDQINANNSETKIWKPSDNFADGVRELGSDREMASALADGRAADTRARSGTRSYNLAVVVLAAAVGGGQRGGALLQVPRLASALGRAGDGDGVDGVGVAVAGAMVPAAPAVT